MWDNFRQVFMGHSSKPTHIRARLDEALERNRKSTDNLASLIADVLKENDRLRKYHEQTGQTPVSRR